MNEGRRVSEPPIEERFPAQWAAIQKLHAIRDAKQNGKLSRELARIVREYSSRRHPEGERARIKEQRKKCEIISDAFGAIRALTAMLERLDDSVKFELTLNANAMRGASDHDSGRDFDAIVSRLMEARRTVVFIFEAWRLTTFVEPIAPSGRPKNTFLGPTIQLAGLWFKITGRRPVEPKRGPGGIAAEPATEFIRRGLQMIYPTIKTQEVRTAIRAYLDVPLSWKKTARKIAEKSESVLDGRRLVLAEAKKRAKAKKVKQTSSKKSK